MAPPDEDWDQDLVRIERAGPIATVILNRADKLNALNRAMWIGVAEVFTTLDADEDLRCVILRGAGDKAMGPGADITEFAEQRADARQGAAYGGLMHRAMGMIRACRHPVIAMIKGLCVGGALELALMCDLRICGSDSRFGIPINRLGLVMAYPEIAALLASVAPAAALEILFEGRVFDAGEAERKGLVNRIVKPGEVEGEVMETARRIAQGAPLVNRWHKKFVYRVASGAPVTAEDAAEGFACFDTDDFREGVRAFLAKQTPEFKGK